MADPEEKPTLWLRPPPTSDPGGPQPPEPPGTYLGAPAPPRPAQQAQPALAPPADNGRATAAMVLGITGLTLWLTSLGVLAVVSVPCSALAWLLGAGAGRRIAAGETDRGAAAARTGVITGVVGVVLGGLAIAFWALVIAYAD